MAEKTEGEQLSPKETQSPKEGTSTKKRKAKRSASNQKADSALSASARSTGSIRQQEGGDHERRRRRSRSTDKVRARRASGKGNGEQPEEGERSSKGRTSTRGSSGRHHTSPQRAPRRVKSEGTAAKTPHPRADRSRSRSPSRASTTITNAPRLPQKTISDSSDLQSALEANNKKKESQPIIKKDSFEEASLGDFQLYAQQQQQKQQLKSTKLTLSPKGPKRMGEIPEESLGSFCAFAKKYEQEKMLGLHDADEPPDVYGQNNYSSTKISKPPAAQPEQQHSNDASMSLGNLVSPMNQYGSATSNNNKAKPPVVEESLGSFAMFHQKYETEKLLGLQDSTGTAGLLAAMEPTPPRGKKLSLPEESMGDFVQLAAAKEENSPTKETTKEKPDNKSSKKKHDGEEKDQEKNVVLPKSRIEKLGKRGGVGYKIMVDTPGGHSPQGPMKIVVAVEFEDETDSEDSDSEQSEEEDPLDNIQAVLAASKGPQNSEAKEPPNVEQADEINESGHLPLSALEEDHKKEKPQHHKKKKLHGPKSTETHPNKAQQKQHTEEDEEDQSEETDEVGPLEANMNRWNTSIEIATGSLKQPEREKSMHSNATNSTHSTISSVTLESALGGGLQIFTDAAPSNQNVLQRKPGGVHRGKGAAIPSSALRRPSGVAKAGGTATMLKRPSVVAPHNLGTRRGLMLRQQSEASMHSMVSTGTSKSNDSSWVSPTNDVPEEYQASFMQLNLTNLEKTEMQTNEEVEQAELPDALRSGVEEIDDGKAIATSPQETQQSQVDGGPLEPIPEGKDPQAAASELLGMKTMLKHIKRVAPKRSKSFEFDKDMPKQMWNKMFAKSQKGELPGSQYVDNDDSTGIEDDNIQSTRSAVDAFASSTRTTGEAGEQGDEKTKGITAGLFSTVKKVAGISTTAKTPENSTSKGKSSLWSSTFGSVMPTTKKSNPDEPVQEQTVQEQTEKTNNMDASEGSAELSGILQELDMSLAHHMDASGYGADDPKGNDGSARGPRSGRDSRRRAGTGRSRAARAQDVHNRSLRDTLDYYTSEQDADDELPQLDAINEEDAKKRPRVRARRKIPNRTKSDDCAGRMGRTRSADGSTRGIVHRTRSQDGSPTRPSRDITKKMHSSFSGLDPSDAPPIRRSGTNTSDSPPSRRSATNPDPPPLRRSATTPDATAIRRSATNSDAPSIRRSGTKTREAPSGQHDAGDAPPLRRQGTKSRDGSSREHGKETPHRTKSHDKGSRGSAGRKQRPQRKKSNVDVSPVEDHEATLYKRGASLPQDATEEELREFLDYH